MPVQQQSSPDRVSGGTAAVAPMRLRRMLMALGICTLSATVGLVSADIRPAEAYVPPPAIPLIPSLGGGVLAGLEVGATAGAIATGGAVVVAGVAAFGASYYGTTKLLEWGFADPPVAGTQPGIAIGGTYNSPAYNNQYGPANAADMVIPWREAGYCRTGGAATFDPAAAGTWSLGTSLCFASGNTVTSNTSGSAQVNFPPWRCKVSLCTQAVQLVTIHATGVRTAQRNFGGFSTAFGPAGSHTASGVMGSSCANYVNSTPPWPSQQACLDAHLTTGWDLWFDPTMIEFMPPPRVSIVTSKLCRNVSTGNTTSSTSTTPDFYGAESVNQDLTPSYACPSGSVATSVTSKLCGPSGAAPCEDIVTYTGDPRVVNPSPSDPYKDCLPGGSFAPCYLKLYKNTSVGYRLCDATTNCASYNPTTATTSQWKCEWGPYVVPPDQCAPLKEWADGTGTTPDSEPNPTTNPNPNPSTNPNPTSGANPSGVPSPSPPVDPETGEPLFDPNAPEVSGSSGCWGDTWSWNPISWVYVPIKCALMWAFVPGELTGWSDLVEQVKARPPMSVALALVGEVADIGGGFSGSGDCGVLADFGDGMEISCAAIRAIPGYNALQTIISVFLVGLTGVTCFHILRGVLGSEGGD